MSNLKINVLANYAGQIWTALMGVIFVPTYISILGMESFGLIGLMLSIQSIFILLDFGLGTILNRELAQRSNNPQHAHSLRILVRTFEYIIWPISLLISVLIYFISDYTAEHWINSQQLTHQEISQAISIMGLAIACYWPSNFYVNALSGLEQQKIINIINIIFSTLRSAGVLVVFHYIDPSIITFMYWHALIGILQSISLQITLWHKLPHSTSKILYFSFKDIRSNFIFSSKLMLSMLLSVALTQLDRIIISKNLTLTDLGYFTLILSITSAMTRMIQPMFNALYPRYSKLISQKNQTDLIHIYHLSNRYTAIITTSITSILILFSKDILYLWTGDLQVADRAHVALSILSAATALSGLMNLPYAIQLAYGWLQLSIYANFFALLLGIPSGYFLITQYGIEGASTLSLIIYLCFFFIGMPFLHMKYLKNELKTWYLEDILKPLIVSAITASIFKITLNDIERGFSGFASIATASMITLLTTLLITDNNWRLLKKLR